MFTYMRHAIHDNANSHHKVLQSFKSFSDLLRMKMFRKNQFINSAKHCMQ